MSEIFSLIGSLFAACASGLLAKIHHQEKATPTAGRK